MKKIILVEHDIAKHLKKLAAPKNIEIAKKITCSATVNVDDAVYAAVDDNPVIQAKITDPVSDAYKDLIKGLVGTINKYDKTFLKAKNATAKDSLIKALDKDIRAALVKFSKDGAKAAEDAYKTIQETKQLARDYKIKAGIEIATATGSLVTSVATTATTGAATGGLTLILGIYSIARTTAKLAQAVYKETLSTQKAGKQVETAIKKLQKNYKDNSKNVAGAKDTGKAFFNKLTGFDPAKTIQNVIKDNHTYNEKLVRLDDSSTALGKKLNTILKASEKATAHAEIKASKKTASALAKLVTKTNKILVKISDSQANVTKGKANYQKNRNALKELEKGKPEVWKKIEDTLSFVDVAFAAGDFSNVGESLEAMAEEVVKQAKSENGRAVA